MSEPVIAGKAAECLAAWRTLCAAVLDDPARRTPLESAIPHLLDAVEAVLALHVPGAASNPAYPNLRYCDRCDQPWPCHEYEAITTALTGGDPSGQTNEH